MHARGPALLISLAAVALVASACGSGSSHARAPAATSRTIASTTTVAATSTARVTAAPSSSAPPTVATTTPSTTPPASTPAPTTAAPQSPLVTRISGLGSARQVIVVAANGYGTSVATLTAYQRDSSGWTQVFGPWEAHIGRNGVAPQGAKREGDGRTPSGVYGFDFMFGVNPNPGVKFPFRAITGTNFVWDDDPSSPNYNEWIDTNTADAGVSPEPMHVGAYGSGAVIAYNDARTPGLGSAIFLHLSTGGSTAGCVSLPSSELLPLLRWLAPARSPRIAIGTFTAS